MRNSDSPNDEDIQKKVFVRRSISGSGLVVAVGGVALALYRPELAYLGMISALIGAGAVDPKTVISFFRGNSK